MVFHAYWKDSLKADTRTKRGKGIRMHVMMPRQLCVGPTLSRMPTTESVMNVLPIIERLIVIMYDRGRSESSVNGERLVLFTQQVKEIENIPPT